MPGEVQFRILEMKGVLNWSGTKCALYHNQKLLAYIPTQQGKDTQLTLPHQGQLRLVLENQAGTLTGSVTFSIEVLPHSGKVWLPIFKDTEDYFKEVHLGHPQILIAVNPVYSPVISDQEFFSSEGDFSEALLVSHSESFISKFQGLQKKIIDLEHNLESERWQFQCEVDSLSHSHRCKQESQTLALEQLHMQIAHQQAIKQDLLSQISVLKEKASSLQKINDTISDKVNDVTRVYQQSLTKHQNTHREFSSTVLHLKNELSKANLKIQDLNNDLRIKESDELLLKQTVEMLKAKNNNIEHIKMKEKCQMLQKQFQESESQRQNLRHQLEKVQQNTSTLIDKFRWSQRSSYEVQSQNLQSQISELKKQLKEKQFQILDLQTDKTRLNRDLEKFQITQETLVRKCESLQTENFKLKQVTLNKSEESSLKDTSELFQVLDPGIYYYKQKQISVSLKEDTEDLNQVQQSDFTNIIKKAAQTSSFKKKILANYETSLNYRREQNLSFDNKSNTRSRKTAPQMYQPLREKQYKPMRKSSNYERRRIPYK